MSQKGVCEILSGNADSALLVDMSDAFKIEVLQAPNSFQFEIKVTEPDTGEGKIMTSFCKKVD